MGFRSFFCWGEGSDRSEKGKKDRALSSMAASNRGERARAESKSERAALTSECSCVEMRDLASLMSEEGKKDSTEWRIFSLKELKAATNNFNYRNLLREGHGTVYRGQLPDGSQIAVKMLTVCKAEMEFTVEIAVKMLTVCKAEMEFTVEVETFGRVRHKNLLSPRGCCAEGQERLIVYDYMPNLSLLSHLHGRRSAECLLDWGRRMNIAIGSAEGIAYLHHHKTPHIIHADIKPSNVLLDSDFQARVANFELAKLIPAGVRQFDLEYVAPEYTMQPGTWRVPKSCDVYSFGLLLLGLASGKKPLERFNSTVKQTMTYWALPLARQRKFEEMADPRLNGHYVKDELKRMVIVALVCSQNNRAKRPTMLEVVELLKGEANEKLQSLENSDIFEAELTENCQEYRGWPRGDS